MGRRHSARPTAWEQLTFFTDSAVYPALSPDGRMMAFIRGSDTFFGPGDVYVKLLPSGDAVQLTHDSIDSNLRLSFLPTAHASLTAPEFRSIFGWSLFWAGSREFF